jgi:hypothetical protein
MEIVLLILAAILFGWAGVIARSKNTLPISSPNELEHNNRQIHESASTHKCKEAMMMRS